MLRNLKQPVNLYTGVAEKIYLAPAAWFQEIKMPVPPYLTPGQSVSIYEDHIFKNDYKFFSVFLAPQKNQLNGTTIGDIGFQKMDIQLEIFIPGSYALLHEFAKNIINIPVIALIKDSDCRLDWYYQLGGNCVYAYVKMDFTTGTTRDGVKGYKGTITFLHGSMLMYKGNINAYPDDDLIYVLGDVDGDLVDADGITLLRTL